MNALDQYEQMAESLNNMGRQEILAYIDDLRAKLAEANARVEQAHAEAIQAASYRAEHHSFNLAEEIRALTPRLVHLKAELRVMEAQHKIAQELSTHTIIKVRLELRAQIDAKRAEIAALEKK